MTPTLTHLVNAYRELVGALSTVPIEDSDGVVTALAELASQTWDLLQNVRAKGL
jgi:hypothetical protein